MQTAIPKKIILQLAIATIVGMPLIAILVDRWSDRVDLATALVGHEPFWLQMLAGVVVGLAVAYGAQRIILSRILSSVKLQYARLLGSFELGWSEIILISLCAGVGEEILFRGAIQPLLGLVLTSLVFVASHGYLNPVDWRISIYGLYMTLGIMTLGYMADRLGLLSAIVAHTVIDIVLMRFLQRESANASGTELEEESVENETEDQTEQ